MEAPTHEVFIVACAPTAIEAAGPGVLLRALRESTGIQADEVGLMMPLAPGQTRVEISMARAMHLRTPRLLSHHDAAGPICLRLSRPSDPPEESLGDVMISWTGSASAPAPGALAQALAEAIGTLFTPELLGFGIPGRQCLQVSLPERLMVAERLPDELKLGGQTLTLHHRLSP